MTAMSAHRDTVKLKIAYLLLYGVRRTFLRKNWPLHTASQAHKAAMKYMDVLTQKAQAEMKLSAPDPQPQFYMKTVRDRSPDPIAPNDVFEFRDILSQLERVEEERA